MDFTNYCRQEADILRRCRRGSHRAFEAVVNRYMKDAYRIALGLVGCHDDAMELSQEAFYRAYRNIKTLKPERKFFPWFYQILRNICFSHLRKRKLRQRCELTQTGEQDSTAAKGRWFLPDTVVERTETKDVVWRAMGKLSEKHREVIILRHFQDMSYKEIARNLFCNKGTVMSRLYHARKQLKEMLEEEKGGLLS